MSCGSQHGSPSSIGNVEDVQNRSVSELIASLRSLLEAIQRRFDHEVDRLRSENESFRKEFVRLNLENIRLQDELRKCGSSNDELRMNNDKLESEKGKLESRLRVWVKKYEELDQRVLRLERDASALKYEESQVLQEPDGLINVDTCGDRGSTWRGNDSKGGGSVSIARNARKKLDFGTGACLSPLAGSSPTSPVKEDGVFQCDGNPPIVEIIESDDDCNGPSKKLLGNKYHGGRNDEKGNKELKRKRGSVSSLFYEPFTQTVPGILTAQQCEQENMKEKDSDNSLSKSTGVNRIKHENEVGSVSTKSDDGGSLCKARWNFEADMLGDMTEDDELCMKAVCALYRWQKSKSIERNGYQGFDGLLSPRENSLAEFLTNGDPKGKLKKSVMDLRDHFPKGVSDCREIAIEHSKLLFIMSQKKEHPFFPSS